jgi:hypothetical protein
MSFTAVSSSTAAFGRVRVPAQSQARAARAGNTPAAPRAAASQVSAIPVEASLHAIRRTSAHVLIRGDGGLSPSRVVVARVSSREI